MSDLISRQAILEKFKRLCDACGEGEKHNGILCRSCYLDEGFLIVDSEPTAKVPDPTEMPKTFIVPITTARAKYCEFISDGKIVASAWKCVNCGTYVKQGQKYCHECGMKLEWE